MKAFRIILAVMFAIFVAVGMTWGYSLAPFPESSSTSPTLTTTGTPANYEVTPSSFYDGVAQLIVHTPTGTFGGSAALLWDGQTIITAAHMISDSSGNIDVTSLTASFFTVPGRKDFTAVSYFLPPEWNGDFSDGYDLALVRLSQPTGIAGYGIIESSLDEEVSMAGYGRSGTGDTGWTLPFGELRNGENTYDAYWDIGGYPYAFDFDNGTEANDALGFFGFPHLGTGSVEVLAAPGDSGGPSFFSNRITGIHSFIARAEVGDIDTTLNGTFGELGGDTRVGLFGDWIRSNVVPEPATTLLLVLGLIGLAGVRRFKK
jgi:hypothetical protein